MLCLFARGSGTGTESKGNNGSFNCFGIFCYTTEKEWRHIARLKGSPLYVYDLCCFSRCLDLRVHQLNLALRCVSFSFSGHFQDKTLNFVATGTETGVCLFHSVENREREGADFNQRVSTYSSRPLLLLLLPVPYSTNSPRSSLSLAHLFFSFIASSSA